MQLVDLMKGFFVRMPRQYEPEMIDLDEEGESSRDEEVLAAYLHKVDVITTLVREKKRLERRFRPDQLLEMLSEAADAPGYVRIPRAMTGWNPRLSVRLTGSSERAPRWLYVLESMTQSMFRSTQHL